MYLHQVRSLVLSVLCFLTAFSAVAQENLVPNPSFEDTLVCPYTNGQITSTEYWLNVFGSCDFFHECSLDWGVPENYGGSQDAHDGSAYVGFSIWAEPFHNAHEFIGVNLLAPLDSGQQYIVGFSLSLADTVRYGVSNVGAHLSIDPPQSDITELLSLLPQVAQPVGQHATNMDGWEVIEGTMIASGGEQYLTIGNFDDDSMIDTVVVNEQSGYNQAYYYLDNVYVVKDTTYHIGLAEYDLIDVSVYPNPASDVVTVQVGSQEVHQYEICDLSGRTVAVGNLNHVKTRLDVSELTDGLYSIRILHEGQTLAFRKLVVQR